MTIIMPPGARTNGGIMVLKSGVMVFQSGVMVFWRFIGGVMVLWCKGFLEPLFTLIENHGLSTVAQRVCGRRVGSGTRSGRAVQAGGEVYKQDFIWNVRTVHLTITLQ